jgi:hypothetical protein
MCHLPSSCLAADNVLTHKIGRTDRWQEGNVGKYAVGWGSRTDWGSCGIADPRDFIPRPQCCELTAGSACLLAGYRHIYLLDYTRSLVSPATLFVHVSIEWQFHVLWWLPFCATIFMCIREWWNTVKYVSSVVVMKEEVQSTESNHIYWGTRHSWVSKPSACSSLWSHPTSESWKRLSEEGRKVQNMALHSVMIILWAF